MLEKKHTSCYDQTVSSMRLLLVRVCGPFMERLPHPWGSLFSCSEYARRRSSMACAISMSDGFEAIATSNNFFKSALSLILFAISIMSCVMK